MTIENMKGDHYLIHLRYEINNAKKKESRYRKFIVSQCIFECFVLNHAFWTSSSVEVYRPTFEMFSLQFTYKWLNDYEERKKWLEEHAIKEK